MSKANLPNRLPAEFAAQQAVWFSWPHNEETWTGGSLEPARRAVVQMIRAIAASGQRVEINVNTSERPAVEALVAGELAAGVVRLHGIPTNDAWCRDHGATFVHRADGSLAGIDWTYNAWGGKYPPYDADAQAARRMCEALDLPVIDGRITLEGGGLDTNGAGLLLTTASCVLNPNRNPGLTRGKAETLFAELLGTPRVLWLEGDLQGDDTDGHVDNLARFADSRTVFAVSDPDPAAPHYHALQENLRLLRAARTLDGRALQVVELPMPARTEHNGTVLPASYANFLIANRVVLMPAYGGPQDDAAQHLLRRAFPHRTIVPVDCRHVVIGLGAVHCLTQHVPASHA